MPTGVLIIDAAKGLMESYECLSGEDDRCKTTDISGNVVNDTFKFLLAILFIVMLLPTLAIWIYLTYTAATVQNVGMGAFAFFLPFHYIAYTVGTLVSTSLKKGFFS